ncbi:periplasmic heavy metal sensor [Roseovarius sp. SCSIO 43702]|uniref:periplasmic heavy metal sensor n=1 Tax=Roseovarius sp. SCSIO 43702 TaxID=2823043 RepID=UPI001C73C2FB|nr:periplasmic heavy metal sensor [Roseovarius sp. SCSIO 43702]QYX57921.1 periplasmic heavy metal sensor [Roseovarius sp. SCSIO 43702]
MTKTAGNGRTKRWLGVLLTASLALNLAVAGAIGGALWMRGGAGGGHGGKAVAGGPLTRALEPEDRREIARALRAERRAAGATRAARTESFDAVMAAVRQVPFDADALSRAMEAHRAFFERDLAVGQRLLIERLSQMSDAERAAFAERVEAHHAGRGRNGH